MRNVVIALLIIGILGYMANSRHASQAASVDPGNITNPVYAEVRFQTAIHDRTFHMVAFAKARDEADCNQITKDLPDRIGAREHSNGTPTWSLESSLCEANLEARNLKLFENKPTFVNYVSATPGAADEREVRIIFWGVTAQEGEIVCNEVPEMQKRWSGSVTCVHALAPQ